MSGTFFAYFVGYNQGLQLADLANTPIDVIILAFANLTSGNTVDMGPSSLTRFYTPEQLKQGIQAFHSRGKKVLLSINDNGGNGPITWGNIDARAFAQNLRPLIQEWQFDGLDLDNEDTAIANNFPQIVASLRQAFPDITLSVPVYNGNQANLQLDQIKGSINYAYTMNYFDGYEGIVSYVQKLQSILGLPGVMAGVGAPGATPVGQSTSLPDVERLVTWQPKAGMMLWAANYPQSGEYIKAIGAR